MFNSALLSMCMFSRFEVTDWYVGEPNQNGGQEDCLSFYTRFSFQWNDDHCDVPKSYICEKE